MTTFKQTDGPIRRVCLKWQHDTQAPITNSQSREDVGPHIPDEGNSSGRGPKCEPGLCGDRQEAGVPGAGSEGKSGSRGGWRGGRDQSLMQSLLSHGQDLGFYSKCNGLSLNDFKQESDIN